MCWKVKHNGKKRGRKKEEKTNYSGFKPKLVSATFDVSCSCRIQILYDGCIGQTEQGSFLFLNKNTSYLCNLWSPSRVQNQSSLWGVKRPGQGLCLQLCKPDPRSSAVTEYTVPSSPLSWKHSTVIMRANSSKENVPAIINPSIMHFAIFLHAVYSYLISHVFTCEVCHSFLFNALSKVYFLKTARVY